MIIYHRFRKKYRKLQRNEIIQKGAMQSWCNGELMPITNADNETIGDTPASFSEERDFYNPINTEVKLTVTLTHDDISEIANDMNNEFFGEKPSQGYLEWALCHCIKERKEVNFFEEEARQIEEEIMEGMHAEAEEDMILNSKL